MYEELSWNMFAKTGDINQYLLYKEMQKSDSSDEYELYKNDGGSLKE
ncbi:MAG: YqzL family protein [Clostridia bacterium]|nr:YqzL family protein [Clostridia bacterium]